MPSSDFKYLKRIKPTRKTKKLEDNTPGVRCCSYAHHGNSQSGILSPPVEKQRLKLCRDSQDTQLRVPGLEYS
eukprot:scaffold155633_cov29-Prasinocladus_malaysianus.AAC.1